MNLKKFTVVGIVCVRFLRNKTSVQRVFKPSVIATDFTSSQFSSPVSPELKRYAKMFLITPSM